MAKFSSDVKKADCGDWESKLETTEHRILLVQNVIWSPPALHKAAIDKNGQVIPVTSVRVTSIKDLGDHLTSLHKMGPQNPCMAVSF